MTEGRGPFLSDRLRTVARMVTPGNRVADVGCDHAFLDIRLVRDGVCPRAIAMDVRKGPLAAAEKHVREAGLKDYIELRLSDGLTSYRMGEAESLICAGMGGRLMKRILEEGMEKAERMRELILQPQSEIPQLRMFLRQAGFDVRAEDAVREDGKYYFVMKAVSSPENRGSGGNTAEDGLPEDGEERLYVRYGKKLLTGRHPVLRDYLRQRKGVLEELKASLTAGDSEKGHMRLKEIGRELTDVEKAMTFF